MANLPMTRVMPFLARGLRPTRRWCAALTAAALTAAVGFGPASIAERAAPAAPAAPAATARPISAGSPAPDIEAQFVSRINSLRASKGLGGLRVDGELLGVARRWTERMVEAGQISHNPNLSSQVSGNWTKLGENVGVGPDVDSLMQAFIDSPAHYRNLVDPDWNYVAAGVTLSADGQIYTTHNFMARADAAPPPSPPPTPAPAAPLPTATPPATVAPTTTTAPVPPAPRPTPERVAAVLDPLRTLEHG